MRFADVVLGEAYRLRVWGNSPAAIPVVAVEKRPTDRSLGHRQPMVLVQVPDGEGEQRWTHAGCLTPEVEHQQEQRRRWEVEVRVRAMGQELAERLGDGVSVELLGYGEAGLQLQLTRPALEAALERLGARAVPAGSWPQPEPEAEELAERMQQRQQQRQAWAGLAGRLRRALGCGRASRYDQLPEQECAVLTLSQEELPQALERLGGPASGAALSQLLQQLD